MKREPFYEDLDVVLSDEDRALRARQVTRLAVGFRAFTAETETEIERMGVRKKEIKAETESRTKAICDVSAVVESGFEKRAVLCTEEIVGNTVVKRRSDTGDAFEPRPASRREMDGDDDLDDDEEPPTNVVPLHGGGAARAPVGGNGHAEPSALELAARIRDGARKLCAKPRDDEAVKKALVKETKATPGQVEAGLMQLIASGVLRAESDGKLLWIAGADEPAATTH